MTDESFHKWAKQRGAFSHDEWLRPYTTILTGGLAESFYKPADVADLQDFLRQLDASEVITWLGAGSNVVIRDGGIKGTVIYTQDGLKQLQLLDEGTVRAEAGVSCAALAKLCMQQGFMQGVFFAAIPGTVGGAIFTHACGYGGDARAQLTHIELINRSGEITRCSVDEFAVKVNNVDGCEKVVAGIFAFEKGDPEEAMQQLREALNQRNAATPMGAANCGEVFFDPSNITAAELIAQCGLAGYEVGGAMVSETHPNYIINDDKCRSDDIEQLIAHIQQQVKQKHNIDLQLRCRIIGELE
ncbi:MAG: UDP-N-acetylmuramate dehydrogenase [Coxiellaceae bacterium]|nr:UDP-N-acetylmuramate dehydrogenase [Coxiellaceae bacterium]